MTSTPKPETADRDIHVITMCRKRDVHRTCKYILKIITSNVFQAYNHKKKTWAIGTVTCELLLINIQ